ncbi:hypothetical protein Shyhy02_61260 [Streptomyces hygroscopicus subsp. hygroscopicus]|nr:hypothetical protein Shyhy02_61260 [Streptomyces hygroscopicus subsp. hygroscopicus]
MSAPDALPHRTSGTAEQISGSACDASGALPWALPHTGDVETLAQTTIEIHNSGPQGSSFITRHGSQLPCNSVESKARLELGGVS